MIKAQNILILDTETGGFDSQINAVTEFAGIAISGETFEEIGRYEALIAPYNNELLYDPQALKATNISMNEIKSGLDFKTFSKDFLQFLRKTNTQSHPKYRTIIAGHNITFDIAFIQQIFYHLGKKMEDYLNCSKDHFGNQQPKYLDTQILAMSKWGNDENMVKHTLSDCVRKIGGEIINAHRAMNDVIANKELLVNFLKSLRNESVKNNNKEVVETRFRERFKF